MAEIVDGFGVPLMPIFPALIAVMCDFRQALSRRARNYHAFRSCSRGPITLASRVHPARNPSVASLAVD